MVLAFAVAFGVALFARAGGSAAPYPGATDTIAFATDAQGGTATGIYLLPAGDAPKMHMVQSVDNPAKTIALLQHDGVYSVAWSPDGTTVYYLSKRMEGQSAHADLWAVRADGQDGRLVRRDFVSPGDAARYPLFTLAAFEGGDEAIVRLAPAASDAAAPSRSPDGAQVAVRKLDSTGAFICLQATGAVDSTPASLSGCFADSPRTSYPAWSPR